MHLRQLEGRADGRDLRALVEADADANSAGAAVERKNGRR